MTRGVLTILAILALVVLLAPVAHAWAYSGWQYRVPITVDNTAGASALTDYQVKVTVDTATLIAAGKMNADCSDVRFADASDVNLPYYIESGCNTASTVIWVKVPSIPAGGTATIYMYYGNPSATSESSGDATFDFFDHFDGTALDAAKWTVSAGSPSVSSSILTVPGGATVYSVPTFAVPYIAEARSSITGYYTTYIHIADGPGGTNITNGISSAVGSSSHIFQTEAANVYTITTIGTPTFNTYYTHKIVATASQVDYYMDGVLKASHTTDIPTVALPIYFNGWSTDSVLVDWVRVRQYANPEPTTSVGAEESATTPTASIIWTTQWNYSAAGDYGYSTCSDGQYLYVVGYTYDEGDGDTTGTSGLVVKIDPSTGGIVASLLVEPVDNTADDDYDFLYGCVVEGSTLYAVGRTNAFGTYGRALLKVDLSTFSISADVSYDYDAAADDSWYGVDTDGTYLYVSGVAGTALVSQKLDLSGTIVATYSSDVSVFGCRTGSTSAANPSNYSIRFFNGYLFVGGAYGCLGDWDGDGVTDDYDYRTVVVKINASDMTQAGYAVKDWYTSSQTGYQQEFIQSVDVDSTGVYAGGAYNDGAKYVAQVWKLDDTLSEVGFITWSSTYGAYSTVVYRVKLYSRHILAAGYDNDGTYNHSAFRIIDAQTLSVVDLSVLDSGAYNSIIVSGNTYLDTAQQRIYLAGYDTATTDAEVAIYALQLSGFAGVDATITYTPTAQANLALDPENNITSITVEYNAVFTKTNTTVTYYRAYDGDTNTTLVEGNTDVNFVVFQRTYTTIGDYNTCVLVEATDDSNNTYTDTTCVVVHIDQYPQSLSFDWDVKIPFPTETITFTGSATDNGTLTYSWDFGDGNTASTNPASHAYASAGTYTVTMTVTDDVGLSKSTTASVPVYSVPELNWTPTTPHAQEPTTFTIIHDSRLTVTGTAWTIPDANVDSETNTTAVARFQHYGSQTVSASFTLTDGTNTRASSVSGTVNIDPIRVTVAVKEEETLTDFDVTHTDNNTVYIDLYTVEGNYLPKTITTTGSTASWDLNNFVDHINVKYYLAGTPIIRQYFLRQNYYEINHTAYLPDASTTQTLQIPFYIEDQTGLFTDPIFIIRRYSNSETIEALAGKKDAEGKVVTYLIMGAEYTLSVWQDGVEKSLGTFVPTTAQPVTLQIGGFVSPPSAPVGGCVAADIRVDKDTNTLIVSIESCETITATITVQKDGNVVYQTTLADITIGEAKLAGVDPEAAYFVTVDIYIDGTLVNTIQRWVSGARLFELGLPSYYYEIISAIVIFATILVSGAAVGWVGGLLAVAEAALFTYWGWIDLPILILAVLGAIVLLGRRLS